MIMVFLLFLFFPVNIEVSDFCGTDCELYAGGSRQVNLILFIMCSRFQVDCLGAN